VIIAVHALHYAIIVGGLVGVAFLLVPQFVHGEPVPRTPEEQRIADLRYTVEAGLLGTGALLTRPRTQQTTTTSTTWLPIACTASAAAAGVHAAVGPAHLEEGLLIGSFFVLSSTAQLAWAALLLRRTTRTLLKLGVVGNAVCVALWAVTRTVGLPFGIIPGPEQVGGWDVAAVTWEVVVVAACCMQLGKGPASVGSWDRWSLPARVWLVASVVALGLLSVTGASG